MSAHPQGESYDLPESDRDLIAAYRSVSTEQPSEEVDERLRAAARRAVGARPRPMGWSAWRPWGGTPMAAAAVVLLSATVVFMSQREQSETEVPAPQERAAPPLPETDGPMVTPAEPQQISSDTEVQSEPDLLYKQAAPAQALPRPVWKAPSRQEQAQVPPSPGAAPAVAGDSSAATQSVEAATMPVAPSLGELESATGRSAKEKAVARRTTPAMASPPVQQSAVVSADAAADGEGDRHAHMVERIRYLLQEGRRDEALAELKRLRLGAPNYRLPSDLEVFASETSGSDR